MASLDGIETEMLKPSVLKEGHLIKLGRSMLKLPKLHYYVLKSSGVYCFEGNKDNDVPRGFIPLEEISLSLGTVVEASTHLHCIKIADKRKVHVLACHSMEIRNSWITAILTAVAQRLVNDSELNLTRKRGDSSCSTNSSDFDSVFCDSHCHFTSPFWTNYEGKRRTKAKRLSVADIAVLPKPAWLTKSKKKNYRSKSLSLEDINSIYSVAHTSSPLARKRSMHDLTRHLFPSGAAKTDSDVDYGKLRDSQPKSNGGKKRWSIFAGMPSFHGATQSTSEHSVAERRKHPTAVKYNGLNGRKSPLVCDTKL